MDRSNNGKVVFEDIRDIGYHTWTRTNEAALFIVGSPHRLMIANEKTGVSSNSAPNIGRCLQRASTGSLAYVHKISAEAWLIKILNTRSRQSELITATLPGSEDFALLSDGTFIMGKESKLYKFNKKNDIDWIEIADLSYYGIDNISRLAIREGKYIAVVEND